MKKYTTALLLATLALLHTGIAWPVVRAQPRDLSGSTLAALNGKEKFRVFDLKQGIAYLDQAATDWRQYRNCTSCHSTFAYILARSNETGAPVSEVLKQTMAQVEARVMQGDRIEPWYKGERDESSRQTEALLNAFTLALYDQNTHSSFRAVTRKALDQMWAVRGNKWRNTSWQSGNASPIWNWLSFDLKPWESTQEDKAGAVLALIATASAPIEYQQKPAVKQGVAAVRNYLKEYPSALLHHRLLLLWGEATSPGLLTAQEKADLIQKARSLQNADGGWSTAPLYTTVTNTSTASDGYGTGFVLLMLRKAHVSRDDRAIQRAITWLRQHQRQSGAWQTLSLNPGLHGVKNMIPARFPTHMGTAFALMALQACSP